MHTGRPVTDLCASAVAACKRRSASGKRLQQPSHGGDRTWQPRHVGTGTAKHALAGQFPLMPDLGRVCTGGGRTYHWRRRRAVQKTVALVSVRPVSAAGRHSLLDKRQSALAACKRCIADRAPLATVVYRSCRLRSAPTGRQKGEGVASSPRPHTHSGAHHQHAYRATNACSTSRRS